MAEITQSERVAYYFHKAYEDKVEVNLIFLMDMCQFSAIHAPCVMIKNKHFVLRVPMETLQDTQIVWGAEVNGYFTIRIDDAETIHFKSKLVRIYNAPPDSMFLVLPLPKYIDHEQRRNSRRVDLDPTHAGGFGVWYGSLEGGDEKELPQQVWRPFEDSECELGELSASGMRLDFSGDNPLVQQLALDTTVLLKGDFGAKNHPQELFILGTVVRKMPRKDKLGLMSIGCHFNSWRRVPGGDNERWFKADEQEGIAIVSQYLIRNFKGTSAVSEQKPKSNSPFASYAIGKK